jgi:hypothetical protein
MYNCDDCQEASDYNMRRRLRCGFIPRGRWIAYGDEPGEIRSVVGPDSKGHAGVNPAFCPGYTIQLPQVQEVSRAWMWWDKSQLNQRIDNPTERLMEYVERYAIEYGAACSWDMKNR